MHLPGEQSSTSPQCSWKQDFASAPWLLITAVWKSCSGLSDELYDYRSKVFVIFIPFDDFLADDFLDNGSYFTIVSYQHLLWLRKAQVTGKLNLQNSYSTKTLLSYFPPWSGEIRLSLSVYAFTWSIGCVLWPIKPGQQTNRDKRSYTDHRASIVWPLVSSSIHLPRKLINK